MVTAPHPPAPRLRELGINWNHWYAVARSTEVTAQVPHGITLWERDIVLYRDPQGQPHALEDRCPHRHVKLSQGEIVQGELECVYHGWRFSPQGHCTHVPYLGADQKLPTCALRPYPIREQDGFIWIFPGDPAQADHHTPTPIPHWEHLNYIASVALMDVEAHYSFVIENLMDMYHGRLHADLQAWADPILHTIEETPHQVAAHYHAQSYYRIDRIWSAAQLVFPALRQLHPEELHVHYDYPNWRASLGQEFRLYCLFCPTGPTHTRAYLLHFTSLEAFPNLHKLPTAFRRFVKNRLFGAAQGMLKNLILQDAAMLEQEQRAFLADRDRKGPELNRALLAVQRLIRSEANEA